MTATAEQITEAANLYAECARLKALVVAAANQVMTEAGCKAGSDFEIAYARCRKAFAALKAAGMTAAEIQAAVGA